MPILNADKARSIIVMKRGMNPGFAGIENELFHNPKTLMVFGDAVIFQFVQKVNDVASNFVLAAVPLFVFMGAMMERSGTSSGAAAPVRPPRSAAAGGS